MGTDEILRQAMLDDVNPLAILLVLEVLRTLDSSTDLALLTRGIPTEYLEKAIEHSYY